MKIQLEIPITHPAMEDTVLPLIRHREHTFLGTLGFTKWYPYHLVREWFHKHTWFIDKAWIPFP